jgi:hypothetical protein
MQRIFSSEGPWATAWMERVLPVVTELAARNPEQTGIHPLHYAQTSRRHAGDVAALFHKVARCDP